MLKAEKIDLSPERRVLSNLIMSTDLMAFAAQAGRPSLFESTPSRIVAGWVWTYFEKTGKAPREAVQDLYRRHARELKEADAELVYDYLRALDSDWEPTNLDLAKDMALQYFKDRAMDTLVEKLAAARKAGDTKGAERLIAEYVKPESRGPGDSLDIFNDRRAVVDAYENEDEPLFKFPRELGELFGTFCREDFVAVAAAQKRGKTWTLMSFAVTPALQGLNALFYSLEMSKRAMTRRFWQYLSGCSRYGEECAWPRFEDNGDGTFSVVDRKVKTQRVDTSATAIEDVQRAVNGLSRGGRLVLRNRPTKYFTLEMLEAELKEMEAFDRFVPDVIVIDYADIMAMPRGNEKRIQLDDLWLGLRGVAQSHHCLVVTASQTGRQTLTGDQETTEADLAECNGKTGHVTHLAILNQTKEERERGLLRVSAPLTRDGRVTNDQVVCAECLAIGRCFTATKWLSQLQVDGDDEPRRSRRGRR